ncbi:nickel-type superoxide dismutase maturation protease [Psychromonas sp. B3M02]|uniref:nickel-type superoxide dismutase maturation protease n=1 Tax=Psychromonas sp. B3M02 TaxID=2267226 RepID=UPI000DEBC9C1|nr:nickel-type superoxide dismutase maturation protease [Psychromonas sp. B3M02]RBW42455.1 nickel-type superoxide dismutase maturation protease [Psychromonas sp. B3M02]
MLSVVKVKGMSMAPRLVDGDYVFVSRFHRRLKVGHLVVVNHATYQSIIKRVQKINANGSLWLTGENDSSVQPEEMGWVPRARVLGKVIFCVCAIPKK